MKKCQNCSNELDDAASFCTECGVKVLVETMREDESALETTEPEAIQIEEVASSAVSAENAPVFASAAPPNIATPVNNVNVNAAIAAKVESHLIKSIIATLCCCLPAGIVAIVYAARVDGKCAANDIIGAMDSSQKANLWGNLAIGLGILVQIIWAISYGAVVLSVIKEGGGINELLGR